MTLETRLTFVAIYALWNVVVFCVYAYDKQAAREGAWRVREDTLILLAIAFGGIGAFACQKWLRHKTKKGVFPVLLSVMAMLQGLLALFTALFPSTVLDALGHVLRVVGIA
ncbi:DUF1294 domain-containing protein [Peteryoungia algae]|uniref:DUF1294 domain-containing protein n=1 Tax=Peteryoungia algae TaxID=2919917 RepID=A0ABT0D282_9HYPH|nr:DUF1294 domain-containing protein [Rhizobium sp. SSM4.3]MCJ8239518.1 DUF1294 domain-containing protein [Rhizobium sp. SSM4.3]